MSDYPGNCLVQRPPGATETKFGRAFDFIAMGRPSALALLAIVRRPKPRFQVVNTVCLDLVFGPLL